MINYYWIFYLVYDPSRVIANYVYKNSKKWRRLSCLNYNLAINQLATSNRISIKWNKRRQEIPDFTWSYRSSGKRLQWQILSKKCKNQHSFQHTIRHQLDNYIANSKSFSQRITQSILYFITVAIKNAVIQLLSDLFSFIQFNEKY